MRLGGAVLEEVGVAGAAEATRAEAAGDTAAAAGDPLNSSSSGLKRVGVSSSSSRASR